ncbi:MAG: cob(I)yrinic acid a,c-diamide adenosyltransferase, partial [Candidatus Korarchaeota archaeon]|nr:cob(I)yrinic acid a,c-diamide adenosyltransferase [Candidatus Korarchaeota archaeon]
MSAVGEQERAEWESRSSGLIHVYTGDGKGKTTAAFGLAMRAVGRGWRVLVIQFLKARESGEVLAAERLRPELEVRRFGTERFIGPRHPREEDLAVLRAGLEEARRA